MQLRSILMVALAAVFAFSLSVPGLAQDDGNFMVRYGSNLLGAAPSPLITNLTDTGGGWGEHVAFSSIGTSFQGNTLISNGNICVNIYAFSPDEQLQWCCQCVLTPNALGAFSTADFNVAGKMISGPQNALVIKMVATALGQLVSGADGRTSLGTFSTCDATTPGLSTIPGQFFPDPFGPILGPPPTGKGLAAWARNNGTETAYTHGTLTTLELQHNSQFCNFNKLNGSGIGYCNTPAFPITAASTDAARNAFLCPRVSL